jgi:hypothetical protein
LEEGKDRNWKEGGTKRGQEGRRKGKFVGRGAKIWSGKEADRERRKESKIKESW